MAAETLNCPNCGAPLDYKGSDPTIRCPYCHTSVVVPEELREDDPPQPVVHVAYYDTRPRQAVHVKGGGAIVAAIVVVIVLIVLVSAAVPLLAMAGITGAIAPVIGQIDELTGEVTRMVAATPTRAPSPTSQPTPTVTPAFANPALTFGKEGNGPGQFSDARSIAVDGEGIIYVADYMGGRIQAFDSSGKYLSQWKVGDDKAIIQGMAANYQGEVFVAVERDVVRYAGITGKELGRMRNSMGGDFGDLKATADGGVVVMWYEGRWGLITSVEGHREDVMIFSRGGELVRTIQGPVSGQTEALALDVYLAVDGDDNLYLMDAGTIYKFDADGRYIDRFGGQGSGPGQVNGAYAIAVDGQGRLYVGGSREVYVFSVDGTYLTSFPVAQPAYALAVDANDNIWVLSRQVVTQYTLKGE